MIRLSRTDISNMPDFNNRVFISGSNGIRIHNLERSVSDTRRKLMELMRDLALAKQQPSVTPISEKAICDFFTSHPAMTILYEDGKLTLSSSNQSVAFHTRREKNAVGINNDIIYVTLPLYSFKLDFFFDGSVAGCAEKSDTLEEVCAGQGTLIYGHPHTQHRNGSRTFGSLCNGNNRFIQDWRYMRDNGIMDGSNTMRILSQAAIWMETANISDMYGTALAYGPHVPENIVADIDVDGLFYCKTPIDSGAPALKFIFDTYQPDVYRMALWTLWIVKHFYSLPDCLNSCNSLYQASLYDAWIILKNPEAYGHIYDTQRYAAHRAEMNRILPIAARCYQELGGYKPGNNSSASTMSQIMPELFPENFNPNNMEEYHVSNQGTNLSTGSDIPDCGA